MSIVEKLPIFETSSLPAICIGRGCIKDPLPGRKMCQKCAEKEWEARRRRAMRTEAEWDRMQNRPDEGRAYIYAMGNTEEGPIKIGMTVDIEARHKAISSMSPLPIEVLGYVESVTVLERRIHESLSDHRSHGEWFHRRRRFLRWWAFFGKRMCLSWRSGILTSGFISGI